MEQMFKKPFTLDSTVRLIIRLCVLLIFIYVVYILNDVLLPFVAAYFIAYILNPIVNFFQNKIKIKNRTVCVGLVLGLLLGFLSLFFVLITTNISKELSDIDILLKAFISDISNQFPKISEVYYKEIIALFDFNNIIKNFNYNDLSSGLLSYVYSLLEDAVHYITGIVMVFLFFLYLFFMMKDFETISEKWQKYVPNRYREFSVKLVDDMGKYMDTYFRKQALISFIVGILFTIAFKIIGLEMAIGLGMLIAVLHMIPYMHVLGIIPTIFIALVQTSQTGNNFGLYLLFIILAFCLIQLIIDGILVPKIMGNATGLHPAVVLLSLSAWGALLGILGMIIALPVTTLIVSYYDYYMIKKQHLIKTPKQ